MKSRITSFPMSTERKKKRKLSFLYSERFKIIEYVCIVLVVLLFLGLAIAHGMKNPSDKTLSEETTPSPVPTADPSVRGMNALNALEQAGVAVVLEDGVYGLTASNGVSLTMRMQSDDAGIRTLSIEALLCPDPTDEGAVSDALRAQNEQTVSALREVLDALLPVFHRSVSDSETIVKQCRTVVEKGTSYAKQLGNYSVRVLSDPESLPQSVTVTFTRDR